MLFGFFGLGIQEIIILLGCGGFVAVLGFVVVMFVFVVNKKQPLLKDRDERDE